MLMLPLGPFALGDMAAAAYAGDSSSAQSAVSSDAQSQWSFEYPSGNRVALNRPLDIIAKLAIPQDSDGGKTQAASDTVTYSATLQYETYGVADEYNTLAAADAVIEGDYYVIRFDNKAVPATDTASNGWARAQQTRFRMIITGSDGAASTVKDFYLYIEPASQTVSFNTCVAADDIDQPSAIIKSIEATYGCTYAYDPTAADPATAGRHLPTPARPNYEFDGWYTSYNATTGTYGTKVDEKSVFTGTAPATLYAKWKGKRYELILVGDSMVGSNQGTLSQTRMYVTYGDTYAALASVTGTGITGENTELRGWTDYFGNAVSPSDKIVDTDAERRTWASGLQILYAVWGEARESIGDAQISGVEESYPCIGRPITLDNLKVTLREHTDASGAIIPAKTLKADKDYVVEYNNNVDVSDEGFPATFTVTGTGKYKGSVKGSFKITTGTPYFDVNDADIYDGQSVGLSWDTSGNMVVQNKLVTDASDVVYKLEGDLNGATIDESTGNITIVHPVTDIKVIAVASKGANFDATPEEGASYTLSVAATPLAAKNVTLSSTSFAYSGKKLTPKVTVKNAQGAKLTEGVDYTLDIAGGCKKVGTYKIKVVGLNGYAGTVSKSFTISPKKCSSLKAKRYGKQKVGGKTYGLYKLKWGKVSGAGGYQVYRTVASKTAKTTFGSKTTSKAFGWQKGKKVTVKVRAFKKVSGKKYYSSWRSITVKVK